MICEYKIKHFISRSTVMEHNFLPESVRHMKVL